MYKKTYLALLLLLSLAGSLSAQSLRITNTADNTDISGDTIVIRSAFNGGFQGFESLDLGIKVTNVSGSVVEVGARKIEEDTLQPDVQHTICFANNCYPVTTFVSPAHINLDPGASDSGFLAHYLFDNRVHVRGISHISYVFYNAQLPADSVAVHVVFNTLVPAGIPPAIATDAAQLYPNPADGRISFRNVAPGANSTAFRLLLTDMRGVTSALSPLNGALSFDTALLPAGIYCYSLRSGSGVYGTGRLTIVH